MENIPFDQALPFRTSDAVLALALYFSGVPEWMPPMNVYDAEMLKKRGYAGVELEAAAKAEFAKIPRGQGQGTPIYWFEKTPELAYLLDAFTKQENEIIAENGEHDAGEAVRAIMARAAGRDPVTNDEIAPMDEREAICRLVCITQKMRKVYVNRLKDSPWLKIERENEASVKPGPKGSLDVFGPTFHMVPLFASDEMKQEMGLK